MKLKLIIIILLISFFIQNIIYSNNNDIFDLISIKILNDNIQIKEKEKNIQVDLEFNIKENNHIYIEKANNKSYSYITHFELKDENNFKIKKIIKPKGILYENNYILKNKGNYSIILERVKKVNKNTNYPVLIVIKTQICNEINNICYPPIKIEKIINIIIK